MEETEEEETTEIPEEEKPDITVEEMHVHAEQQSQQAPASQHEHPHEHAEYIAAIAALEQQLRELDARCSGYEGELATLRGAIAAKRERGPDEDHFWNRKVFTRE
jgi:hypothetical protein